MKEERNLSSAITLSESLTQRFAEYRASTRLEPLFFHGDSRHVLGEFPSECIDCVMTSPPYWGQRSYSGGGGGLEQDYQSYIENLASIFSELRRVLKTTGSFWLNIGDTYWHKNLLGLPWRVAFRLMDNGWTLRNSVIWNKVKGGPDNSKDKLRNVHENVFHFVKSPKGYFYDADAIRSKPGSTKVVNGAIVSATGVSGVRYRRQIELSTALNEAEKEAAYRALGSQSKKNYPVFGRMTTLHLGRVEERISRVAMVRKADLVSRTPVS